MKSARILIVEDEILIAHGLSRMLKKWGYEVLKIVATGNDAIAAVQEQTPDVILMDIAIRGDMNGLQTSAEILKEHPIPMVYLTAYSDEETLNKIRAVGGNSILIKPYKKPQLKELLEKVLSESLNAPATSA